MKIISLQAENIKRLQAVEIRPTSNLVEISGRNGQGKTSVLDSIWWALGGNRVIQPEPIRKGQDVGTITLDLGHYVVKRTFRRKGDDEFTTSLTVQNPDGAKFGDPQVILNKFIGDLTFDPLAFSRMKPKDQVVALRSMVAGFDFDAADKANDDDFKLRTDINRSVRELAARIEAIKVDASAPTERVNTQDLLTELQEALDGAAAQRRIAANRLQIETRISTIKAEVTSREESIERLKREIEGHLTEISCAKDLIGDLEGQLEAIPAPGEEPDTSDIRDRIANAETVNRTVDQVEQRKKLLAEHDELVKQSDGLTKRMEERKKEAAKAVRDADLPITGLELTEEEVLLNGAPFIQASDAEQLRVSIAVAGAMNPMLRIIRVRDGSLLDAEAMVMLEEYANTNDMQIWIERVDSSGKSGIVIEDGMVKETTVSE